MATGSLVCSPSGIVSVTFFSYGYKVRRVISASASEVTVRYWRVPQASSTWTVGGNMPSTTSLVNVTTLPYQMEGLENYLGSRSKPQRILIFSGVLVTHVESTSLLGSSMLAKVVILFLVIVIPLSSNNSNALVNKSADGSSLIPMKTALYV